MVKHELQDLADNIVQDQELLKKYEDDLRYETEPKKQTKYSREIKELNQSIAKHRQEYAELKEFINRIARISGNYNDLMLTNQSSLESSRLLSNLLLQIDFQAQIEFAQTAIEEHQVLSFLVHGQSCCGQEILVKRLYRIKSNWQKQFPISIDVSNQGIGYDLSKLWGRLAEYLGLSKNIERRRILERICDRLKTQDVIITFSQVEVMLFSNTLIAWLEEFWQPLVNMVRTIEPFRKTHLLMFLVGYRGSVCKSQVTLVEVFNPINYNPFIPLCLPPASPFSVEVLKKWLTLAIGFEGLTMQGQRI